MPRGESDPLFRKRAESFLSDLEDLRPLAASVRAAPWNPWDWQLVPAVAGWK